jgi:glycosyltransferase involved in cell wall biosynthesis
VKVAIVHDWFVGGGAERVVFELHKMYPEAPIYTAYCSKDWRQKLAPAQVITSYMQHWPFSKMRKLLPLMRGRWFSQIKLDGYDLVISSTGAEAKAVKTGPNTLHICYCHAPTHYYWSRYEEYMKNPGFGPLNPLARLGLKLLVGPRRRWDYKAAQNPDYLVVNSKHTKMEVKKYYGRNATVIYPPVDVERFKPKARDLPKHGYLIAGRQTPYKRFDLAVAACSQLNVALKVIGDGPDHNRLVKLASPRVTFLTKVSDEEMPFHFQRAAAFLFPGIDDFGVVAVEALAAGTPVIAYGAGGALDYVIDGKTGQLFEGQTVKSLAGTIKNFEPEKFRTEEIVKQANKFKPEVFQTKLRKLIDRVSTKKVAS